MKHGILGLEDRWKIAHGVETLGARAVGETTVSSPCEELEVEPEKVVLSHLREGELEERLSDEEKVRVWASLGSAFSPLAREARKSARS